MRKIIMLSLALAMGLLISCNTTKHAQVSTEDYLYTVQDNGLAPIDVIEYFRERVQTYHYMADVRTDEENQAILVKLEQARESIAQQFDLDPERVCPLQDLYHDEGE